MPRPRLILVVVLVALGALAYYVFAGSAVPAGQPELVRLDAGNFGELRTAFNSATDSTRLIALLSPT